MKPKVSLLRVETYDGLLLRSSLSTLLAPMGGMSSILKPGDRVLLKPNLLTGSRPTKACVTDPRLTAAVAELVIEAGGKPFLGDSPAFGSALGVAEANGYGSLMTNLGVPIVEFTGKRYETCGDQFNHLRLSKEAMEADVIINLPKVKSHVQLTLTLGVKNLFGCVPGKMKTWWHLESGKDSRRFAMMLVETASTIASDLTIVDGIVGHEGNGPSGGEPRQLGILGASTDVFALDRAVADILGANPLDIPTIAASMELGLCSGLDEMTFPHLHPQDLHIHDWKFPQELVPIDFGLPRVIRSIVKHLYIRFIKEASLSFFAPSSLGQTTTK